MKGFPSPVLLCFCGCILFFGCQPKHTAPAKSVTPAEISKKLSETDLITIRLTPEAEQRLGIATTTSKKELTARFRDYAGELLLPLGHAAQEASTNAIRSVFSLLPAMSAAEIVRVAELQVEADGQISAAVVQLKGARIALKRAEELIAGKAGAGRVVDDARLQVQLAEAQLQTAESRRALLGAPLFEAIRTNLLWIRVPVYVGDLSELDVLRSARLYDLGNKPNSTGLEITPIRVPFSTAGPTVTTDLYYELSGTESYRPGQKFAVSIPLREAGPSVIIPTTAVLYDIHGDAWVYVQTGPHTFARQRIEVRYIANGGAALGRGLKEGIQVVTAGSVELFGTEFGPGK